MIITARRIRHWEKQVESGRGTFVLQLGYESNIPQVDWRRILQYSLFARVLSNVFLTFTNEIPFQKTCPALFHFLSTQLLWISLTISHRRCFPRWFALHCIDLPIWFASLHRDKGFRVLLEFQGSVSTYLSFAQASCPGFMELKEKFSAVSEREINVIYPTGYWWLTLQSLFENIV